MKNIKAKIVAAVDKIFRKFASLVETGTLRRLDPVYSPDTGVVGTTGVPDDDDTCDTFSFLELKETRSQALGRLIASATNNQAAGSVRSGEFQILVKQKGMTLEPSTEDRADLRGFIWDIVKSDPLFGVAYILTLRRQNA